MCDIPHLAALVLALTLTAAANAQAGGIILLEEGTGAAHTVRTPGQAPDSARSAIDSQKAQDYLNPKASGGGLIILAPTQSGGIPTTGAANTLRRNAARAQDYMHGSPNADDGSGDTTTVIIVPQGEGGVSADGEQRLDNNTRLKINSAKARGYMNGTNAGAKTGCSASTVVVGGIGETATSPGGRSEVTVLSNGVNASSSPCR